MIIILKTWVFEFIVWWVYSFFKNELFFSHESFKNEFFLDEEVFCVLCNWVKNVGDQKMKKNEWIKECLSTFLEFMALFPVIFLYVFRTWLFGYLSDVNLFHSFKRQLCKFMPAEGYIITWRYMWKLNFFCSIFLRKNLYHWVMYFSNICRANPPTICYMKPCISIFNFSARRWIFVQKIKKTLFVHIFFSRQEEIFNVNFAWGTLQQQHARAKKTWTM